MIIAALPITKLFAEDLDLDADPEYKGNNTSKGNNYKCGEKCSEIGDADHAVNPLRVFARLVGELERTETSARSSKGYSLVNIIFLCK